MIHDSFEVVDHSYLLPCLHHIRSLHMMLGFLFIYLFLFSKTVGI